MSPSERQLLSRLISALPRDITLLMIEHDMDVAQALADRVTVLHRGNVSFQGRSLAGWPAYSIAQAGIALVPQGRRVYRSLTVRENLQLPTSSLARPRKGPWNLDAILREFPQLAEPSEGLSPRLVLQVGEMMKRLREHGLAVVLVEQNLSLALSVADYLYVLASGRFVFEGTPEQLSREPAVLDEHLGVSRRRV